MRHYIHLLAAALLPMSLAAQQDPVVRLGEVLPTELAAQVIARVDAARQMELLVADMGRAREALQAAGHEPVAGEIEAATTALRMGIDGADVSNLARSGPAGRSLAVPLLVLGALAQRGLPSDQALAAVSERLAARAGDAELLVDFGAPGGGAGLSGIPSGLGRGRGGTGAPAAGVDVPVGPQTDAGRPPQGRGRGNGPPGN